MASIQTHGIYSGIRRASLQSRATWALAVAIGAATALLYVRVGAHQFLSFDDNQYVSDNARVGAGLTWDNVRWAFGTLHFSNWHPLTWLSHMLDVQLFGLDPGAHHLVNAGLHALNAALLFLVLARMTGAPGRSALVAALFAVHPLHVESVAWISERKDVLSTVFGFLALWAYHAYAARPGARRYATVVAFFGLSLMAKPMWVTLPFLLLLLDAWPLDRLNRRTFLEKIPLLLLSAASSMVTIVAQNAGGALAGVEVGFEARVANALISYVRYLGKTIWPARLAIFYPFPAHLPMWQLVGAAMVLLAITAVAVVSWRRAPWVAVGWLWFLGTLVPVIGLVQVGGQAMADRYTYLPLIGLFVIAAWTGHRLLGEGALARSAAVGVMALLAVLTWRQLGRWGDDDAVFGHAIAAVPPNARAHSVLATSLLHRGRLAEAAAQAEDALRIEPYSARHRLVLAMVHFDQKRLVEAREELSEAVRIAPRLALAWSFLGEIEGELGRPDAAIAALNELARLTPNDPQAWNRLGVLYGRVMRFPDATEAYRRAVQVRPSYVPGWRNLGVHLARIGQPIAGAQALRRALQLDPRNPDILYRLGLADLASGEHAEVLDLAARLDAIDPVRAADLRSRAAAR